MMRFASISFVLCCLACPASHEAGLDASTSAGEDAAASVDASVHPDPTDAGVDASTDPIERCFGALTDPEHPGPVYGDAPIIGSHCSGTNHQEIADIERLVFLGDSITAGTFPTPTRDFYRTRLTEALIARFGPDLEVSDCSESGATTPDLLEAPSNQIEQCFPEVEEKRTLVILTMGGNDLRSVAQDSLDGATMDETMASIDEIVDRMREAIGWFRADPARFPAGVSVIFGNIYEFTDGEGDLQSCPGSALVGLDREWPEGRQAFLHVNEGFMQVAVETGTDLLLLLENFCGHGYHAGEPDNQCYRGPDAERWFDFTCIHPNPTGHEQVARMFLDVVGE